MRQPGAPRGFRPSPASISLGPLFQKGFTLHQQGKLSAAEDIYKQILRIDPRHFDALHLFGVICYSTGRSEQAASLITAAIRWKPGMAAAHNNLGIALLNLGRLDESLAAFGKAITLSPDYAEAYSNRGTALQGLKRLDLALADFDRAVSLNPGYSAAYYNRGNVLTELERREDAAASFGRAIELKPDFATAYCNRGNMRMQLGRFDLALHDYERALALQPNYAEVYCNRGAALFESGRFDEAKASLEIAIAQKPDYAMSHWNKALALLIEGDFDGGWPEYEWRKLKEEPAGDRSFPQPLWTGHESIAGKTILVHWEQGMGDTMQVSRFVPLLEARGATVLFAPQPQIRALMRSLSPSVRIADHVDPPSSFDFHCPTMSLPHCFGTTVSTIPNRAPYLSVGEDRIERWRGRVGSDGFRVGICWQGNLGRIDLGRSFAVTEMRGLSRIAGVRLISLQKGEGERQLDSLPPDMRVESLGGDFDAGPDAFLDTAAVMKSLDLVITSDTAVAHLAGALAVPTWVALKYVPDFRWLLDRSDSPWYPTMRLFRQTSPGDWGGLFADIETALKAISQAG